MGSPRPSRTRDSSGPISSTDTTRRAARSSTVAAAASSQSFHPPVTRSTSAGDSDSSRFGSAGGPGRGFGDRVARATSPSSPNQAARPMPATATGTPWPGSSPLNSLRRGSSPRQKRTWTGRRSSSGASNDSRGVKPPMPATMLVGTVWTLLL